MSDEKAAPVTDSEKLADQMAADITSGKVATKDRPVVRKALDDADGRSKSQDAGEAVWRRARHYTPGLGGAMKPAEWERAADCITRAWRRQDEIEGRKPNNWRMGPDGKPREVN
jgi:hypothetical protein